MKATNSSRFSVEEDMEQNPCTRGAGLAEFVPVIFAHNDQEADHIKEVLEGCGIPTLVDLDSNDIRGLGTLTRRVPVLVPAEMQHDASEIVDKIEHQVIAGFDEEEDEDEDLDDDFDDEDDLDSADEDDDTQDEDDDTI